MSLKLMLAPLAALLLATCAVPPEAAVQSLTAARASNAERLAEVLAHPRRDEDRARDVYRHPRETIEFFGLTPDMTVADVLPAGGWYTRVLLPYVGEEGGLIGLDYALETRERLEGEQYTDAMREAFLAFGETWPEQARAYAPEGANVIGGYLFDDIPPELNGTVDAVLFVRALHNMRATSTMHGAVAEAYALLKPGGVVGVVQHRANPAASAEYANGSRQYMHEDEVIAAFEAAGFVLEARSEINANRADPANWPNGARTLPPTLTLGLLNRADYLAIGESDRMTLRFRKPGAAP